MPSVKVRTTQNVLIEYPIASVGDRVAAHLIDFIIKVAYVFLIIYALGQVTNPDDYLVIIFYLPVLFYNFLFELFMNGQSPGKVAMRIKVIKLDGSRPGVINYFLRWIFRTIEIWFSSGLVAFLFVILTSKGQRLGDLAAGTTVIKLSRTDLLTSNPLNTTFDDEYEPVYKEVIRLSDAEIDLIEQALDFNRKEGDPGPANLLAEKLASKMGVRLNDPPIKFLHVIKKDYYHVTSR